MLVNAESLEVTKHVKFISYTGKWPNLCGGILTLEIDGVQVQFGNEWNNDKLNPRFWEPGRYSLMTYGERSEWQIDVDKLPEKYRKYAAEIDQVFNSYVEYGHCGGCR